MTSTDILQLALLILPTLVVVLVVVLRHIARRRLLALIGEALASQRPLDPETLAALLGQQRGPAERDLRRGVMLLAIGLGLAAIGACVGVGLYASGLSGGLPTAMVLAGLGVMPICIGLALIWLARSQPR